MSTAFYSSAACNNLDTDGGTVVFQGNSSAWLVLTARFRG
jgi:hypothetical protein